MKNKIIFSFLLITILLLSCATTNAGDRAIEIYVNGNILYAPASTQIINGRTMVPIRFIAEALDCDVKWDEAASRIIIESKNNNSAGSESGSTGSELSPGKEPVIEGTNEFKDTINGVLALAKEKDIDLYNWYIDNADKIKLEPISDRVLAMNVRDPFTNKNIVLLDESTFKIAKARYSQQDLKMFYVGLLAHECAHTMYFDRNLFTDDDVEALCSLNAARAVERVGGNSRFYKFFIDDVNRHLEL